MYIVLLYREYILRTVFYIVSPAAHLHLAVILYTKGCIRYILHFVCLFTLTGHTTGIGQEAGTEGMAWTTELRELGDGPLRSTHFLTTLQPQTQGEGRARVIYHCIITVRSLVLIGSRPLLPGESRHVCTGLNPQLYTPLCEYMNMIIKLLIYEYHYIA